MHNGMEWMNGRMNIFNSTPRTFIILISHIVKSHQFCKKKKYDTYLQIGAGFFEIEPVFLLLCFHSNSSTKKRLNKIFNDDDHPQIG